MWIFIRNWTLPIAMISGALAYLVLANIPLINPYKPCINEVIAYITPSLIFAQLLLAFCKIDVHQLLPRGWHVWLLLVQLFTCLLLAAWLYYVPMSMAMRHILEGGMVCLICPTATAASVITGKLGGNTSSLVTYTLMSNLLAAIIVPLVFPLVEPHQGMTFLSAFFKILSKVFPLLLAPFFTALFFQYFVPRVHRFLLSYHDLAFYIWAFALALVTAQTVRSLVHSTASPWVEASVALAGLIACCFQFVVGKGIGTRYHDRISAGQALGQKNTVFAIWMAVTYLNPLSSVGPGSYVVWQNIINSWQLWKKRK